MLSEDNFCRRTHTFSCEVEQCLTSYEYGQEVLIQPKCPLRKDKLLTQSTKEATDHLFQMGFHHPYKHFRFISHLFISHRYICRMFLVQTGGSICDILLCEKNQHLEECQMVFVAPGMWNQLLSQRHCFTCWHACTSYRKGVNSLLEKKGGGAKHFNLNRTLSFRIHCKQKFFFTFMHRFLQVCL